MKGLYRPPAASWASSLTGLGPGTHPSGARNRTGWRGASFLIRGHSRFHIGKYQFDDFPVHAWWGCQALITERRRWQRQTRGTIPRASSFLGTSEPLWVWRQGWKLPLKYLQGGSLLPLEEDLWPGMGVVEPRGWAALPNLSFLVCIMGK